LRPYSTEAMARNLLSSGRNTEKRPKASWSGERMARLANLTDCSPNDPAVAELFDQLLLRGQPYAMAYQQDQGLIPTGRPKMVERR
jgi:hypothetical protein